MSKVLSCIFLEFGGFFMCLLIKESVSNNVCALKVFGFFLSRREMRMVAPCKSASASETDAARGLDEKNKTTPEWGGGKATTPLFSTTPLRGWDSIFDLKPRAAPVSLALAVLHGATILISLRERKKPPNSRKMQLKTSDMEY